MKGRKQKLAALLLAALLLLSGCAVSSAPAQEPENPSSAQQSEQIALLEQELQRLKQQEEEYITQIAALQAQITELSTKLPADEDTSLAESVTFRYRKEDGGVIITGYAGSTALLTVPATLDGAPVIGIGDRAFQGADLTAVILPEGIREIGWFAFYECTSLSAITLPATLSSIGYGVFDGCPSLTLHCPLGSYAEDYAKSYALSYTNT